VKRGNRGTKKKYKSSRKREREWVRWNCKEEVEKILERTSCTKKGDGTSPKKGAKGEQTKAKGQKAC